MDNLRDFSKFIGIYHVMHRTHGVYAIRIIRFVFSLAGLAILLFVSGCASTPKSYGIKGEGDPILNRDVGGKSLSVVVRLYQLRSAQEFSKLTFDALADGRPESELLGPALIDKTDVVIVPGGGYSSTEKLNDETKYLGIVAFFRRPDQYYWRQLVGADAARSNGLTFRVQDCYIALNGIKPVPIPGQPSGARPDCGAAPAPAPSRLNARGTGSGAPAPRQAPAQQYPQQQYQQQYSQQQYPQQQYPQQQYPQQPYAQQYPQPQYGQAQQYPQPQYQQPQYQQAPTGSGKNGGGLLQGMPDVNVSVNTPLAPTNVRVGSGGVSSVSIGSQAPQPAPAQPYYGQPQPYYGQPYPAQQPYPPQQSYPASSY